MSDIITVNNFEKSYGDVKAVKNINFSVEEGSFFAFLGPNGAGKSTTINTLCTLLSCDIGDIIINGHKLGKEDDLIKSDIGIVFQESLLDDKLTIRENLYTRGSLYSLEKSKLKERIEIVSEAIGITDYIDRRYGRLSGGQRRRADIARALINEPKVLFLDEPTTGLDPKTRLSIWGLIKDMQKKMGVTVFLTTHYMEEAAEADKIVIINKGKIVEEGTPAKLKSKYTKDRIILYKVDNSIFDYLNQNKISYEQKYGTVVINITDKEHAIKLICLLKDMIESFEVKKGNMDDMFLNVLEIEV